MRAIFAITLAVAAASVSTIDGAALSGCVFSCDAHRACIGDGICVATWVVAICAHCMCLAPLNDTPQRWLCFCHNHASRSRSCCAALAAASVPFLLVLQPRAMRAQSVEQAPHMLCHQLFFDPSHIVHSSPLSITTVDSHRVGWPADSLPQGTRRASLQSR
jgi:hypothetical protein